MLTIKDLINDLRQTCIDNKTGTFFITTVENRACHILIEKGVITALSYGRHRGKAVIDILPILDLAGYSFKDDIKMPLAGRSFVDADFNVLKALNIETEPMVAVSKKPKRIYRGQVIMDDGPVETSATSKSSSDRPKIKKTRMYRGHILDD